MTTLDKPTTIPESKALRTVVEYVAPIEQEEDALPLESLNGLEPGELDPSILSGTYYDDKLQMSLPLYASSSVYNNSGNCDLYVRYQKTNNSERNPESFGNSYDIRARNLANKHLPQQPVKKEEYLAFLKRNGDQILGFEFNKFKVFYTLFVLFGVVAGAFAAGILSSEEEALKQTLSVFCTLAACASVGSLAASGAAVEPNKTQKFYTHLKCQFPGKIPKHIRELVQRAKDKYDDIHMVWEAQNKWEIDEHSSNITVEKRQYVFELDPLIFGEKKGRFYYIGCFDVTPRESTILGEFVG